jgi:hypothetical protein
VRDHSQVATERQPSWVAGCTWRSKRFNDDDDVREEKKAHTSRVTLLYCPPCRKVAYVSATLRQVI